MQGLYERLARNWLGQPPSGVCLKTDLFEEAISAHTPLNALGPGAVGIDVSPAVVQAARANGLRRGKPARFVVGDLRSLPFQSGSFDSILSGSSLDHFSEAADLNRSLTELGRLLKPGGVLAITFDNPQNPAIWIRNHLPFGWLNRVRLVPYYVGLTYSVDEARAALEQLGLTVTHTTAVGHAPRAPAMWLLSAAARLRWAAMAARVYRLLEWCELFETLPTRYRTGYYIALRAKAPLANTETP